MTPRSWRLVAHATHALPAMDQRNLAALQGTVDSMDVVCNEALMPRLMQTQSYARRRLFPVRSSEHVARTIKRIAIMAGEAGDVFEAGGGNRLSGRGAREDFTRLIGTHDGTFSLWNYRTHKVRILVSPTSILNIYYPHLFPTLIPTQILDRTIVNTTLYAMGIFCLMFNTRLFAPETYHLLVDSITTAPHMVSLCIPTGLLETHGFTYPQIVGIAWDYMCQLHSGLNNVLTLDEMVALMNSPVPLVDEDMDEDNTSDSDDCVDVLSLLISAAANNT